MSTHQTIRIFAYKKPVGSNKPISITVSQINSYTNLCRKKPVTPNFLIYFKKIKITVDVPKNGQLLHTLNLFILNICVPTLAPASLQDVSASADSFFT